MAEQREPAWMPAFRKWRDNFKAVPLLGHAFEAGWLDGIKHAGRLSMADIAERMNPTTRDFLQDVAGDECASNHADHVAACTAADAIVGIDDFHVYKAVATRAPRGVRLFIDVTGLKEADIRSLKGCRDWMLRGKPDAVPTEHYASNDMEARDTGPQPPDAWMRLVKIDFISGVSNGRFFAIKLGDGMEPGELDIRPLEMTHAPLRSVLRALEAMLPVSTEDGNG